MASNKHEHYSCSLEYQYCLGSEVPTKSADSYEDNKPSLRGDAQRFEGHYELRKIRPTKFS